MFLGAIASKNMDETFEVWDKASRTFLPSSLRGRISITDRFLSNFNKPLRRRMLYTEANMPPPLSRVIRHPSTQEVYLLGQTRMDANALKGQPYVALTVCHLASDDPFGTSGIGVVKRREPVGPPSNPGWLSEKIETITFMDSEFRTSVSEDGVKDSQLESYTITAPNWVEFKEWDVVELNGAELRVTTEFKDSGFSCARTEHREDPRVDLVVTRKVGKVYDETTHKYVASESDYNVTARVDSVNEFSSWLSESESYVDLLIEETHIGFPPESGMLVNFSGKERTITSVSFSSGESQYKVRCK